MVFCRFRPKVQGDQEEMGVVTDSGAHKLRLKMVPWEAEDFETDETSERAGVRRQLTASLTRLSSFASFLLALKSFLSCEVPFIQLLLFNLIDLGNIFSVLLSWINNL